MISLNLSENYNSVSAFEGKIALAGESGISIVTSKSRLRKINNKETQLVRWWRDDKLGACRSNTIEVYSSQESIWRNDKHLRPVRDLTWSESGLLTSCSTDSMLYAWDLRTQTPAITFNATKGVGIFSVAWHRFSNDILASAHDTAIKLWDARLPRKSLYTLKAAHPGRINCIDWSYLESADLLSSGLLSCLKVWKTSPTNIVSKNTFQSYAPIIKALYVPSSNDIVYAPEQAEGKIHVLDAEELKFKKTIHLHSGAFEDLDWDSSELVTLSSEMLKVISFENEYLEESSREDESLLEFDSEIPNFYNHSMSLEEELKLLKKTMQKEGVLVEDKGLKGRYCIIRVSNYRNFIRYMVTFPSNYPKSPPKFIMQGNSFNDSSVLKTLDKGISKLAYSLSLSSQSSLCEVCKLILTKINKHTASQENFIEGLELENTESNLEEGLFLNQKYSQDYVSVIPASSGHFWHPSGKLFTFLCYQSSEQPNEGETITDDFFEDIKVHHFDMGIK